MTIYAYPNYKSKKELKEAVAAGELISFEAQGLGSMYSELERAMEKGEVPVCGPHYPKAHAWYASVVLDANGHPVKVK